MHFEVLVEEISAETALRALLPEILGPMHTFQIRSHRGKPDLLAKLPDRLKGYRSWIPDHYRLVILIDEDRENCHLLKDRLESLAADAGFRTRSCRAADGSFIVLNRIAVEELEAWLLGDPEALRIAFPKLPRAFHEKARYRLPDAVKGGTWEALEALLQQSGYYPAGLAKIETARRVAEHMDPDRNRSPSFCQFRDALREMAAAG